MKAQVNPLVSSTLQPLLHKKSYFDNYATSYAGEVAMHSKARRDCLSNTIDMQILQNNR